MLSCSDALVVELVVGLVVVVVVVVVMVVVLAVAAVVWGEGAGGATWSLFLAMPSCKRCSARLWCDCQ